MDQEEAPPPYSAVDPLLAPANNRNGNASQASIPLRANSAVPQDASSSRIAEQGMASSSTVVPAHFSSAAAYFEQRPPTFIDESRGILHHHMTIYPRSQAKDFPRRPRCWASRVEEIAQQDWDTFLRYLFPPHLGLAAASQHLPRQLRAEIQRDRKDRPQESDEERRARIAAVIDEWNQCFFELRAARIAFVYIGEPDAAPASALCPRCYPAATKATQGTGTPVSMDGQPTMHPNAPSPVVGQHAPSPTSWPPPPMPPFANPHLPPIPYGSPWGVPTPPPPGTSPNQQPPGYYPPPPPPPPGVPPWQWNNWAYSQPQYGSTGTSKGGAFGWISHLTSQAQKYGERFAEQAQQYGDQISAHAMHYGRQVEEQALAHGRWIEEQARLHGRKPGAYPAVSYPPQPTWMPPQNDGQITGVVQTAPTTTATSTPAYHTQTQPTDRIQTANQNPIGTKEPSTEKSRRTSISSTSSESSLSSIDSLSTTSDLSASDLANIRSQLQSLNDRHDRTLHEAAVDLRRQLDVLQESRREARMYGRRDWRQGWGRGNHDQHHGHAHHRHDRNDWGRWESPEQQQRQSAERQALKEEMRATRKAFREVSRRARDEQRDKTRRRNRRRHGQPGRPGDQDKASLDGRLKNLTVDDSAATARTHAQTTPAARDAQPRTRLTPVQSEVSSVNSGPGTMHAPAALRASPHDLPADAPDRKTRLKEMLKPRNAKKQQQQLRQPRSRSGNESASAEGGTEPGKILPKKDKDSQS
ncbi:uncharacterized protein N7459_003582 [Penicillium hispanicum]|uniref:uncharacterized protein n=1 Tax=Penicillium hispanicum TaxID=1080232 RepID=UPI0025410F0C|nr:uncharacterized protein N7459_003582 [Penicillium hispanicum]KAJ5587817.1 hypothetical protein N7459_003582 [Penicillium hispanicum]